MGENESCSGHKSLALIKITYRHSLQKLSLQQHFLVGLKARQKQSPWWSYPYLSKMKVGNKFGVYVEFITLSSSMASCSPCNLCPASALPSPSIEQPLVFVWAFWVCDSTWSLVLLLSSLCLKTSDSVTAHTDEACIWYFSAEMISDVVSCLVPILGILLLVGPMVGGRWAKSSSFSLCRSAFLPLVLSSFELGHGSMERSCTDFKLHTKFESQW